MKHSIVFNLEKKLSGLEYYLDGEETTNGQIIGPKRSGKTIFAKELQKSISNYDGENTIALYWEVKVRSVNSEKSFYTTLGELLIEESVRRDPDLKGVLEENTVKGALVQDNLMLFVEASPLQIQQKLD